MHLEISVFLFVSLHSNPCRPKLRLIDQLILKMFNDAVSTVEVIRHQMMWEDDHEWWVRLLWGDDCVLFEDTVLTFSWRLLGKSWYCWNILSYIFSEFGHYTFFLQRGADVHVQSFFEICIDYEWFYQMAPLLGTYWTGRSCFVTLLNSIYISNT
jgi:hypothetical protein